MCLLAGWSVDRTASGYRGPMSVGSGPYPPPGDIAVSNELVSLLPEPSAVPRCGWRASWFQFRHDVSGV